METALACMPTIAALCRGLTSALRTNGHTRGQVTVLDREPNLYTSSYPSEIVRCRLDDGRELHLFCKYSHDGHGEAGHGHWSGLAHEAAVYRHILAPSPVSTPGFYGMHADAATGETWLILAYLDRAVRLGEVSEPDAISPCARWLGRFHAAWEAEHAHRARVFLRTYDAAYYHGWADRTARFAGPLHDALPWLAPLCARFRESSAVLAVAPLTVIHGEFYPRNILSRDGTIYPIDWESAAIAAGEIDLASLIEGWDAASATAAVRAYCAARWPQGAPPDFARRLAVARLFLGFRWLGDRPEWTTGDYSRWRFDALRSLGADLRLI